MHQRGGPVEIGRCRVQHRPGLSVQAGKFRFRGDTASDRLGLPAGQQPAQVVPGTQHGRVGFGDPAGGDRGGVRELPPAIEASARLLPAARRRRRGQPVEPGPQAVTLVVEHVVGQTGQGRSRPQDAAAGPLGVRRGLLDESDDAGQQLVGLPQRLGQGVVPSGQFVQPATGRRDRRRQLRGQALGQRERIGGGSLGELGQQPAGDGQARVVVQAQPGSGRGGGGDPLFGRVDDGQVGVPGGCDLVDAGAYGP